jgi:hypothetical protein
MRINHAARLAILTVAVLCLPGMATAQDGSSPKIDGMIEISGQKNPLDIPEYAMWRHVFAGLALIDKVNILPLRSGLPLSPPDAALVYGAAHEAVAANERCLGRQERIDRSLAPQDHQAALNSLILGCRQETLDRADRLVAGLTAEGAVSLRTWASDRRKEITAFVPRDGLEFFRRPR